jgi:SPP1 gp7 family putative phage head morphogenesis protein
MNNNTPGKYPIPEGYVLLEKGFAHSIIEDAVMPQVRADRLLKVKDWYPGEKAYAGDINNIINQQVEMNALAVEQATIRELERREFVDALTPHTKEILDTEFKSAEHHLNTLYEHGKDLGFSQTKMESFIGKADAHALQSAKQYNYGLIVNVTNDVREGVRQSIYKGVLRGDSIPTIAKDIRKIPLEPIKAGNRVLSPSQRATLIARTESARAVSQGTLVSYAQSGTEEVDVDTAADERTCDYCTGAEEDGPYPINNIPEDAQIPIHPDCRCAYSAVVNTDIKEPFDADSYFNLYSGGMTDIPEGFKGDNGSGGELPQEKNLKPEPTRYSNLKEAYTDFKENQIPDSVKQMSKTKEWKEMDRSFRVYRDIDFEKINDTLRMPWHNPKGLNPFYQKVVDNMDKLLGKTALKSEIVVKRVFTEDFIKGWNNEYSKVTVPEKTVGTRYTDKGYSSSCLTEKAANMIREEEQIMYDDSSFIGEITLPKGTEAIPIDFVNETKAFNSGKIHEEYSQAELVINRNGVYDITEIDYKNRTFKAVKVA